MGRKRGRPVNGWLIIDKPLHIGSTDVVNKVRRLFNARKAGHGGTLDPLASGVLPVAFGQATRTIPFIMEATKQYRFTLEFGISRTTDDREGEILQTSAHRPGDDAIRAVLPSFIGDILQTPPIYSALKLGGTRAYDLARKGKVPVMQPRPARIDRIFLVDRLDEDHAIFDVQSGKGVYMRALARDIALACGTVGHITSLRRKKSGPFTLSDAITLDKLLQNSEKASTLDGLLLPLATALDDIPALATTEEEAQALRWGQTLPALHMMAESKGALFRAECRGEVIGLCRVEEGRVKPVKIFDVTNQGVDDVDYS